jgi:tetratricopeptide (TPR) repeat protein
MKSSLRIARASKSASRIAEVARYYGVLLARLGRVDEALALLDEARTEFGRAGERGEVLVTDARIAESLVFAGRADEALELAVETLRRAGTGEGVFILMPMLERVRGLALMQLGRLEEARAALVESERRARADSADYEVALALDALVTLGLLEGRPAEKTERERDRIFGRLGVVRTPRIPLPLSAR